MDVLRFFDAFLPVAEQVIDVPMTEVPTILYSLKQTVDTPVPRGGKRRLQGFHPEQSSSPSSAEQIIGIPVLGRGVFGHGGPQGFLPGQGFSAVSRADR